jgi:hypothetical protein
MACRIVCVQVFGPEALLTQALMSHEGVEEARDAYYEGGGSMTEENGRYYQYTVDAKDFVEANWNYAVKGEDDLRAVLGSYQVSIVDNGDGMVTFQAYNASTWESATRIPIARSPSVMESNSREETGPDLFSPVGTGGNMYEYFIWIEPIDESRFYVP